MSTTPTILVIGSGVAGQMAALSAVDAGCRVQLLANTWPERTSASTLRDGLACGALFGHLEEHIADTLSCAQGLADPEAVRALCAAAPTYVALLERFGLVFDRTREGTIARYRSLASSHPYVAVAGASTGQRVLTALASQLLRAEHHERIGTLFGWEFLSLVLDEHGICRGAVAQNLRNLEVRAFPADAVIMATGGYAALFGRHCSTLTSDGTALIACAHQGALFTNPEFVQVRPLTIPLALKCRGISDTVLNEGARPCILREGKPWYFLEEWHVQNIARLTREEFSRLLWRAVRESNIPDAAASLDLTHLDHEHLHERLASLVEQIEDLPAVDTIAAPIEVVPAIGRSLGGLHIDRHHATTISGLYAAGSAACAYHGAGLLGGNELLASLHGGNVAGRAAATHCLQAHAHEVPSLLLAESVSREEDHLAALAAQEGSENAHSIASELGELLFEVASVEKEDAALEAALKRITVLGERLQNAKPLDTGAWANTEVLFLRRAKMRIELAKAIVMASLARHESRGTHYKPASPHLDSHLGGHPSALILTANGWAFESQGKQTPPSKAVEHVTPEPPPERTEPPVPEEAAVSSMDVEAEYPEPEGIPIF